MRDASEYLSQIKAIILFMPWVVHWDVVREEAQGDVGVFRYRLNLDNGGLLEMFELFRVVDGDVQVSKYSFHWQNAKGQLLKRWDNAAHHPDVTTYPHHIHDGAESNVLAHQPVCAEMVLDIVKERLDNA